MKSNNILFLRTVYSNQIVKFGFVGLLNTIFSFGVTLTCLTLFQLDQILANLVGFVAGIPTAFIGHFFVSFGQRTASVKMVSLFLGQVGLTYGVNLATLVCLAESTPWPAWLLQLVTQVVTVTCSYLLNRVIFNQTSWQSKSAS